MVSTAELLGPPIRTVGLTIYLQHVSGTRAQMVMWADGQTHGVRSVKLNFQKGKKYRFITMF